MSRIDIDELVDEIVTLPTLPQNVDYITRLINEPDPSMPELGRAIASDPAFALKTLRLVNSAYYGLRQEVASVELAVTLLGLKVVRNLVVTALVCETLRDAQRLLLHSVATGIAARAVTACLGSRAPVDPEGAFTYGLLHDIGRIVVHLYLPEAFEEAIAQARNKGVALHRAERAVMGADHAEMGARLALRWKLPARVTGAIAAHHDPAAAADPPTRQMAGIIAVADSIATYSGLGALMGPYTPPDAEAWAASGVQSQDLPAIAEAFFGSLGTLHELVSLGSDA